MPSLLSIYTAYKEGNLTIEQMAHAFNRDLTALKAELTRRGTTLPAVLATLDGIQEGTISRDQAAETLGTTQRNINKLMLTWGVKREMGVNVVTAVSAEVKWKIHYRFACDFIAGRLNLDRAAEAAQVDPRQMRRIVTALIAKHFNMTWKELGTRSFTQLQQLAREIMVAEAIDQDVQRVTDAISSGKMDRLDYSLRLIAAKRAEKAAERAANRQAKLEEARAAQAAAKKVAAKAAARSAKPTKPAKTP